MLKAFFLIFPKLCFLYELTSEQDTPTHIITFTFNFNTPECNLKIIKKVELNRFKEDVFLSEIPVKSMFLGTNRTSINIIVENLLSDELCCTGFFHIVFYKEEDKVYGEYVFEINKINDGLLIISSESLKGSLLYLDFVFNSYLKALYEIDEKFLTVPKSNILCTKKFVTNHKNELKHYFKSKKGLKQTVISLNNCLSQIKEPKDIPVQIKSFFNERSEELNRINDTIARFEGQMGHSILGIEDNLVKMMVDVLILLERCTDLESDFRYIFLAQNNISTSLKVVREFPIPDTLYKKKNSTIHLRILPDGNLYQYFEKDLWFSRNKLYVSRKLCDSCRDSNSSLEIFNLNEKEKTMTLELYKAWL